jgi:hypothetical protein
VIGTLPIDMEKARERFRKTRPGIFYLGWDGRGNAVNGITISETMYPSSHDWGSRYGPQNLPTESPKMTRSLKEILGEGLGSRNRIFRNAFATLMASNAASARKEPVPWRRRSG